jgi:hypothetical protein
MRMENLSIPIRACYIEVPAKKRGKSSGENTTTININGIHVIVWVCGVGWCVCVGRGGEIEEKCASRTGRGVEVKSHCEGANDSGRARRRKKAS